MSNSLNLTNSGSTTEVSSGDFFSEELSPTQTPPWPPASPLRRRKLPCEASEDPPDPTLPTRRRSSISTRHILSRFQRYEPSETLAAEREKWNRQRMQADEALKKLEFATKASPIWQALASCLGGAKRIIQEESELKGCWATAVDFHAPLQARVPVHITDFKDNSATHHVDTVGNIEQYLHGKPADVRFRWIHVPVGKGLLHSTIEELFNYAGSQTRGRPFCFTGHNGWPYPEIVMLSFWSQEFLASKASAHKKLSEIERKAKAKDRPFSVEPLEGLSTLQKKDLRWRAKLHNRKPEHWHMSESDFPSILEQPFLGQASPLDPKITMGNGSKAQALSQQEKFEGSVLMTSSLRAFHRDDGFILTMSSPNGVHYLGENFRDCIDSSPEAILSDPDASIFGHTFETFRDTGISTWGYKTAEWFMIYLFTEAAVVPHNMRHGCITLSYLQGFVALAKDLESQQYQYDRTKGRHDRSEVVHQYVECIRNLKALHALALNKQAVIARMTEDYKAFEEQYKVEGISRNAHPEAEQAGDRLEWAKGLLVEEEEGINRLLTHFQNSLKIVFQQQSIELNELAVVADSQNSAILIFTTVTIVFLPLSFLTSYFGMNLQGVVDTQHDQPFFWRICSGFATALLVLVFVTAYKKELGRRLKSIRQSRSDGFFASSGLAGLETTDDWKESKREERADLRKGEV